MLLWFLSAPSLAATDQVYVQNLVWTSCAQTATEGLTAPSDDVWIGAQALRELGATVIAGPEFLVLADQPAELSVEVGTAIDLTMTVTASPAGDGQRLALSVGVGGPASAVYQTLLDDGATSLWRSAAGPCEGGTRWLSVLTRAWDVTDDTVLEALADLRTKERESYAQELAAVRGERRRRAVRRVLAAPLLP